MKVSIENMRALKKGMERFSELYKRDLDSLQRLELTREVLTDGALKAYGYSFQYHEEDNCHCEDYDGYRALLLQAQEKWDRIGRAIENWLRAKSYGWQDSSVADSRSRFE